MEGSGTRISRRDFLKKALFWGSAFGIGGVVGSGVGVVANNAIEEFNGKIFPYSNPDNAIKATASALKDRGMKTEFEPIGKFSKEVFDYVCNSTLNIENQHAIATGVIVSSEGVDLGENRIALVTNRHVVKELIRNGETGIIARKLDMQSVQLEIEREFYPDNEDIDLCILVLRMKERDRFDFQKLSIYKGEIADLKDEKLLNIGFPRYFDRGMVHTHIIERHDLSANHVYSYITNGSSGSPIITVSDNGSVFIAGLVFGFYKSTYEGPYKIGIVNFEEINKLMEKLKGEYKK